MIASLLVSVLFHLYVSTQEDPFTLDKLIRSAVARLSCLYVFSLTPLVLAQL